MSPRRRASRCEIQKPQIKDQQPVRVGAPKELHTNKQEHTMFERLTIARKLKAAKALTERNC